MILGLRQAVDVRVMTQHATSLSSMNEKTLSSVLQTARSSLGAWSGRARRPGHIEVGLESLRPAGRQQSDDLHLHPAQ